MASWCWSHSRRRCAAGTSDFFLRTSVSSSVEWGPGSGIASSLCVGVRAELVHVGDPSSAPGTLHTSYYTVIVSTVLMKMFALGMEDLGVGA